MIKKEFLDRVMDLIKEHAKHNEQVISSLKFSWTQTGYNLMINGYTVELRDKPKPSGNERN